MLFDNKKKVKKAQTTIFIIVAVVLVAGVFLYVYLQSSQTIKQVPAEFQPAYTSFLNCFEQDVSSAVSIVESQGGYIYLPEFEPGSSYMPFSSQLNFLGNPIPYWYYVSGNNIIKEQVPSESFVENQISSYIENKIKNCNFKEYSENDFSVFFDKAEATTSIKDSKVEVKLDMEMTIEKESNSVFLRNHKISVDTNLGKLLDSSKKVFNKLKEETILENYSIDVLRSYAPVDGIEISCSPKIWSADVVFDEIQNSVELNINSINQKENKYFKKDFGVEQEVKFLTSKNWPHNLEVSPSQNSLMIAEPVGNQAGLGIIGFCYVPYHFVYSLKYPVLVQVQQGEEIFQFPFAVVIQNNVPRESLNATAVENPSLEICDYKNTEVEINIKDREGKLLTANVSYECLDTECFVGMTSSSGSLNENFPQCVNGYIISKAQGYKDSRYLFSTTFPGSVDMIMEKNYPKEIEIYVDGKKYNEMVMINFVSSDDSKTLIYPDNKIIELSEGQYEIQVTAYKNSSIKLGSTTKQQCMDVAKSGILGFVGFKEEKCFDIFIPEQVISNAIYAGGKQTYFVSEFELSKSQKISIDLDSFGAPKNVDDVQKNYILLEEAELQIDFK